MIGKLKDLGFDRDGHQTITVTVRADFAEEFDRLKDGDVEITIKKYSEKRSKNANDYCWVLCTKIAERLDAKTTKEDVYRNAIREVGIFKDFPNLTEDEARTLAVGWGMIGTGWISERVDYEPDGEHFVLRCYYGSSRYNARQMNRLIDNLLQDAQALGIQTETPDEIAKIKSLWEQEYNKRKEKENG